MDTGLLNTIIGIVGTLIGTILGWILNELSRKGKLKIYMSSFTHEFNKSSTGLFMTSANIKDANVYSFELSFDIYNSSGDTKIMRDLKIVFKKDKRYLFDYVPRINTDEPRKNDLLPPLTQNIGPLNIPPKSVAKLEFRNSISLKRNNNNLIWEANKIYLEYINENNKTKSILIKEEDFRNYFKNHEIKIVNKLANFY